ncbi:MAG: threonine synthase [Spirochaetaceae bacterium]|nr:threonine synthase [Spirochaetaceae bacterium]
MKFTSSRVSKNLNLSFSEAVLNCFPQDGGMYVPIFDESFANWILYMNGQTSFQSIAGTLTSAMIKDEFSPIICESIATKAFPFSPKLVQLDENLFSLELYHGPTGCYKDFAISYFASCLENILIMQDKKATILAVTNGVTGACIAEALKNKTRLKAVLLYTKGSLKKIDSSCLLENGGNIVQIEVNGSEEQCFEVVRQIFKNKDFTSKYNLTLANSVNIGRVLPMIFPYIYAFSRLKNKTCGDIFYAMDAGNYGNLVSGLYAWKSSLPVNGFITNCTDTLILDSKNKCTILEEKEPLAKSISTDLGNPSNLERLEAVFQTDSQLLKGLVFPSVVTEKDKVAACKLAFKKYGYILDDQTSLAFAATIKQEETILDQDGCVVLIARNHPGFSNNSIKQLLGKTVELPESIKKLQEKKLDGVILPPDAEAIMNHIKTLL